MNTLSNEKRKSIKMLVLQDMQVFHEPRQGFEQQLYTFLYFFFKKIYSTGQRKNTELKYYDLVLILSSSAVQVCINSVNKLNLITRV